MGLLGDALQKNGTEVIIEKNNNKNKDDIDVGTTCLQFISTGLSQKTKYDLHFDFGKKRNDELLTNEQEYKKFKNRLIEKLSKDYNIPKNKIIVAFPEKGSFKVQVIFQSNEFNNLNIQYSFHLIISFIFEKILEKSYFKYYFIFSNKFF